MSTHHMHHPFSDMLLNPKASKKLARDAELKQRQQQQQQQHRNQRDGSSPAHGRGDEQEQNPEGPGPGPVQQSVLPLRQLFARHLEDVALCPTLLNNMPIYYAVVEDVLQRALQDTEVHLRARSMDYSDDQ